VIGWPGLGAVTHVAGCSKGEIDIAAARASPIIFPPTTCIVENGREVSPSNFLELKDI